MCKSGSGSNQPEPLSMEYPTLPACETTTPPAISKPTTKKAAKGKAKIAGKKKKKKEVSVPHDSPAMGTRSKTTPQKDSPASQTKQKKGSTSRSQLLVDAVHFVALYFAWSL